MSASNVTLNTVPQVVEITINPDGDVCHVSLTDTVLSKVIFWTFADNANGFPSDGVEGQIYLTLDEHGVPGDADYVQDMTLMFAKGTGSDFNDFYYK